MVQKKSVWLIESNQTIGRYLHPSIFDDLYEELRQRDCDEFIRMDQGQFLGTYIDHLNNKLLHAVKGALLPMVVSPPTNQPSLSRPGSAKKLSRPNSALKVIPVQLPAEKERVVLIIDIQCADAIEALLHVLIYLFILPPRLSPFLVVFSCCIESALYRQIY